MYADDWRRTMRPILLALFAILAIAPWIVIGIMILDAVFAGSSAPEPASYEISR